MEPNEVHIERKFQDHKIFRKNFIGPCVLLLKKLLKNAYQQTINWNDIMKAEKEELGKFLDTPKECKSSFFQLKIYLLYSNFSAIFRVQQPLFSPNKCAYYLL